MLLHSALNPLEPESSQSDLGFGAFSKGPEDLIFRSRFVG